MDPGTLTLIGGVGLLLVFALVGSRVQRSRTARDGESSKTDEKGSL